MKSTKTPTSKSTKVGKASKYGKILKKAGKEAASKAIRQTKALGLDITYVENGQIIKEDANGNKKVIGTI